LHNATQHAAQIEPSGMFRPSTYEDTVCVCVCVCVCVNAAAEINVLDYNIAVRSVNGD